jgi:hypothetical protein
MKYRKSHLRLCAQVALRKRGFSVTVKGGAGIVSGARLLLTKDKEEKEVAVRTSLDREVGCTRRPDGNWTTISRVDEIIVAVPSAEEPNFAEIFCFESSVMTKALEAELKHQLRGRPHLSHKAPIFLPLDDRRDGKDRLVAGLKGKAIWHDLVPLASVPPPRGAQVESTGEFIERVKLEFAQLNKVEPERVSVEFRIVG